ncbi:hypothetical protein TNCV_3652891 [Trichonephila clavipes]|nr:hypothetical protein TNCV_3652891 [Trichonephila clavipes]
MVSRGPHREHRCMIATWLRVHDDTDEQRLLRLLVNLMLLPEEEFPGKHSTAVFQRLSFRTRSSVLPVPLTASKRKISGRMVGSRAPLCAPATVSTRIAIGRRYGSHSDTGRARIGIFSNTPGNDVKISIRNPDHCSVLQSELIANSGALYHALNSYKDSI